MLLSLDMPSLVAEDVLSPSALNAIHNNPHRKSLDRRPSASSLRRDGVAGNKRATNGDYANGINGFGEKMPHLTNGHGTSDERKYRASEELRHRTSEERKFRSSEEKKFRNSEERKHRTSDDRQGRIGGERKSLENGGPVEPAPRKSRASKEESRTCLAGRLAPRDDGYFANGVGAKVQEGWFSEKVYLGAINGDGAHSGFDSEVASPNETEQEGDEPADEPDKQQSRREPEQERAHPAVDSERSSVERTAASLGPSRDHRPHRISAPPVFSNHSTQSVNLIVPGKLQQRHTLEVPRVCTSRLSREGTNNASMDEVITASGRYTPSSPTRRKESISLARRMTRSIHSDLHLDNTTQEPEAAVYADMVRQKRMSRRKRKEEEEEDRVLVGTKVDQNHVNYVMAYNMLTGIRFTVSRTNAKMDRDLTDADFGARHKFSFDVTGAELTPSAKYDFKFKDYAPWVFRRLRTIFKIDPADYLMSLTSKYILSELGSPGKSGSFFYFSRDYKYIIKTIHHAEHKLLRSMLREYYNHVKGNPNTLLSQFYGLHRVKIPYGRKVHFVVMNNLFPPHRDIHKTYDLKGSTIGRLFKEENLKENPRATLKDLNWLDKDNHLEFGPTKREAFVRQMERDVKLLQRMKIMDYSLLVGIHDLKRGNEEQIREKTLQVFQPGGDKEEEAERPGQLTRTLSKIETARKAKELRQTLRAEKPVPMGQAGSKMPEEMEEVPLRRDQYFYQDDGGFQASHEDDSPGDVIYYLGIIDCLTHYGLVKRIEHFWKSLQADERQISPIPPDRYGDRFVRFISGITSSPEHVAASRFSHHQLPADPHSARSEPENEVIRLAEKSRERASREIEREDARIPDTKMSTTTTTTTANSAGGSSARRSGSVERGDAAGAGFTLPVLEEAAEDRGDGATPTR